VFGKSAKCLCGSDRGYGSGVWPILDGRRTSTRLSLPGSQRAPGFSISVAAMAGWLTAWDNSDSTRSEWTRPLQLIRA
jgi:hypothetical protein